VDKVISWCGLGGQSLGAESSAEISCGQVGEVAVLVPGV